MRVVRDLDEADIDEGTVLVCRATDPSWASLFPLAEAVVTDVGSAMSHAAIVCRDLGLPCVAGTRNGTTTLRDGMQVRVDGTTGRVRSCRAPQRRNARRNQYTFRIWPYSDRPKATSPLGPVQSTTSS